MISQKETLDLLYGLLLEIQKDNHDFAILLLKYIITRYLSRCQS